MSTPAPTDHRTLERVIAARLDSTFGDQRWIGAADIASTAGGFAQMLEPHSPAGVLAVSAYGEPDPANDRLVVLGTRIASDLVAAIHEAEALLADPPLSLIHI